MSQLTLTKLLNLTATSQVRLVHTGSVLANRVAISRFEKDVDLPHSKLQDKLKVVRKRLNRPLTLSEKILYSHLDDPATAEVVRGESYLKLRPDRYVVPLTVLQPFMA